MDKPTLYRFKVVLEKGQIERLEIKNYNIKCIFNKNIYIYRLLGFTKFVEKKALDKLLHGQIYSFNPDFEHAKAIVREHADEKKWRAFMHGDYLDYTELKNKLNGWS